MPVVRDVRLGRLLLAHLPDNLQETVGDILSADDGGVAVARRRPRQFTFVFPLHGLTADPGGPFAAGARMRRQMRSMAENAELRENGLYFAYTQDPELNGWISIGGGQISYVADQGGVQTGSFQLELDSAFKRGSQRTHRDARRVEHWDLRLSTVERDYRGVIFGTDFSGLPVLQLTFLPVGVRDPLGPYRTPVFLNPRVGIDGAGSVAQGLSHASVVSFEQAEVDQRKGDVVILDRQGNTAWPPASGTLGTIYTNLVPNPSFESPGTAGSAPTGWGRTSAYWTNPATSITEVAAASARGQVGSFMGRLQTPGSAAYEGMDCGVLPLPSQGAFNAGRTYMVRCVMSNNGPTTPAMQVFLGAASANDATAIGVAPSGSTPQTIYALWTPSQDETTVYAGIRTSSQVAADVFIDQFHVVDVTGVPNPQTTIPYFDGSFPGYVWNGQPNVSSSSGPYGLVNLVGNPNLETGITGYGSVATGPISNGSAVATSDLTTSHSSSASMKVVTGSAGNQGVAYAMTPGSISPGFLPGQPYTMAVWMKAASGAPTVIIAMEDNLLGNGMAAQNCVLSTSWQRFTVTWTPTAWSANSCLYIYTPGVAATFNVDDVIVSPGAATPVYFDGDSPGAGWTATRGNSASYQPDDNQAVYGYEEIYGPDQPLTASDAPLLQNGHCRVRFVSAGVLAVDVAQVGGGWGEQGRVTVWDSLSADAYTQHTYAIPGNNGALATVMEYTPERAVLRFSTLESSAVPQYRIDTYVTLQRGWSAPRFEAYINPSSPNGCRLMFTPNYLASMYVGTGGGGPAIGPSDDALTAPGESPNVGTFAAMTEPWFYVQPTVAGPGVLGAAIVSILSAAHVSAHNGNEAYGGANRESYGVAARYNEVQASGLYGYASMRLGFNKPGPGSVLVASMYLNGSVAVVDSGSTNPQVAKVAVANGGVVVTTGAATDGPLGTYGFWARMRADAGTTYAVSGGFNNTGGVGATVVGNAAYAWFYMGQTVHAVVNEGIFINTGARTVGTGALYIDRVVCVPTERRQAASLTFDGARDLGASSLLDSRAIPHLQGR